MPNTALIPFPHASAFRRIAAVAWDPPREPNIYGTLELRAEALLAWLDSKNASGDGPRLSVTHAVARAIAMILRRHPDLNALIRWGRLYMRRDVDIFLQVLVEGAGGKVGGADLSGLVVRNADQKSIEDMADEIRAGARRIRAGDDADFKRTKKQAFNLPPMLLKWSLRLVEFLQFNLNVDTTFLGAPRDPFGSAMVTSVGMLGIRMGYAPFFPLGRLPICLMVGAIEDTVVPENGVPAVGQVLTLNATFDHRVIDGFHAAVIAREIRLLIAEPHRLDLPVERAFEQTQTLPGAVSAADDTPSPAEEQPAQAQQPEPSPDTIPAAP